MRKRKRALWLAVIVLFAPSALFLLAVESLNLLQSVPLQTPDGLLALSEKPESSSASTPSRTLHALPQRSTAGR